MLTFRPVTAEQQVLRFMCVSNLQDKNISSGVEGSA